MRARASFGEGRLVGSSGMEKSSRMKNLYSSSTLAKATELRLAGKVPGVVAEVISGSRRRHRRGERQGRIARSTCARLVLDVERNVLKDGRST